MQNFNFTMTSLSYLNFKNTTLIKSPIIRSVSLLNKIIISNSNFNGGVQDNSNILFSVGTIGSIIFQNHTFTSISCQILEISKYDLSFGQNSAISNVNIINSTAPLIRFGNFINPVTSSVNILLENITYTESIISSSISFISTENIISSANVNMIFNNLKFNKIQFTNKGYLLSLVHKMTLPIIVSNSSFTNLSSAIIYADSTGSDATGLTMQTKFVNCVFDQINGKFSSLLSTNNGAVLEFTNSIFTNIYTYEEGAVLYAGFEKTSVSFTSWVFQNNSAVQGTIFVIESESFVKWTNCTLVNNFSITNTIFMSSLNGYFEFYNSNIYNNYAITLMCKNSNFLDIK